MTKNKQNQRLLSAREAAFLQSLNRHGFKITKRRKNLKYKKRYIILSTKKEDLIGIDFWIKLPKSDLLLPIQITQRGVKMFKKYRSPSEIEVGIFIKHSRYRINSKQRRCKHQKILFVLVCDFQGDKTNLRIARHDIRAFRYALAQIKNISEYLT